MKQKITKMNYFILFFTFIVEIILINILIKSSFSISIYNNIYKWININTIFIALDIIFVLFMLDFALNRKSSEKILNMYKTNVNLKLPQLFIFLETR